VLQQQGCNREIREIRESHCAPAFFRVFRVFRGFPCRGKNSTLRGTNFTLPRLRGFEPLETTTANWEARLSRSRPSCLSCLGEPIAPEEPLSASLPNFKDAQPPSCFWQGLRVARLMNAASIIACPNCGQKLGIPSGSGTVHVTCPKCTARWDWPLSGSSGASASSTGATPPTPEPGEADTNGQDRAARWSSLLRGKRLAVALLLLGAVTFICYRNLTYTPAKPLLGAAAIGAEPRRPTWNLPPEQSLPDNGHGVFAFDQSTTDSRLRIVPRGGQGHVVLKAEGAGDANLVCWIFIRQGESAEIPIPSGSYRLKLACGKSWYGEEHLFGPGASYSAISTEIKIPTRTVYTIDLHPSKQGSLKERPLRPQDF